MRNKKTNISLSIVRGNKEKKPYIFRKKKEGSLIFTQLNAFLLTEDPVLRDVLTGEMYKPNEDYVTDKLRGVVYSLDFRKIKIGTKVDVLNIKVESFFIS